MPSSKCGVCGRLLVAGHCRMCDPLGLIKKLDNLSSSNMEKHTEMIKRLNAAEKVARESRYLISNHGIIDGPNSKNLIHFLTRWLEQAGDDKFERPELDDQK